MMVDKPLLSHWNYKAGQLLRSSRTFECKSSLLWQKIICPAWVATMADQVSYRLSLSYCWIPLSMNMSCIVLTSGNLEVSHYAHWVHAKSIAVQLATSHFGRPFKVPFCYFYLLHMYGHVHHLDAQSFYDPLLTTFCSSMTYVRMYIHNKLHM